MAEALAFGASVIAVLQISSKVASLSYNYLHTAKDAAQHIASLRNELRDLENLLLAFQGLLDNQGVSEDADDLASMASWLDECHIELEMLVGKLEQPLTRRQRLKLVAEKLLWPLKEADTAKLLDLLSRKKSSMAVGLGIENLSASEYYFTRNLSHKSPEKSYRDLKLMLAK